MIEGKHYDPNEESFAINIETADGFARLQLGRKDFVDLAGAVLAQLQLSFTLDNAAKLRAMDIIATVRNEQGAPIPFDKNSLLENL